MYKKLCRFAGAVALYSYFAHYVSTHYIAAGLLCFLLISMTLLFFLGRNKRKQNKLNVQTSKKFERMNNSELVAYRKHLSSCNDVQIYNRECMRRFGFIERTCSRA